MYIDAELSITFNFDDEGKKRIEEAIETIREIIEKIGKAGLSNDYEIDCLGNTENILKTILEEKTLT